MPVLRPTVTETTALGAALLAGLGVGLFASVSDLAALWRLERRFDPRLSADEVAHRRARWAAALARAKDWETPGPGW